MKENELLKER